jgi:hypothetical protein
MANLYPPAVNTISGDNITASRFANSTPLLSRALRTLADLRYVGSLIIPNRVTTTSGAINWESPGEGLTAADAPELVAPGAEYRLTQTANGAINTSAVAKYGEDTIIEDEAVSRFNFTAINKSIVKMNNSAKILIDAAVVAAVAAAATNTAAATQKWDGSGTTPFILRDILKARAKMRGLNLGYDANALLVDEDVWAYLAADPTIAVAMAREDKSNPIYTGKFEVIAGLEVIPVPALNLPGGVNTAAFLVDRANVGFILTENLGGGYSSAGDLTEFKSWRTEDTDGVRCRIRANFKAVVTDPGAIYKITTVV